MRVSTHPVQQLGSASFNTHVGKLPSDSRYFTKCRVHGKEGLQEEGIDTFIHFFIYLFSKYSFDTFLCNRHCVRSYKVIKCGSPMFMELIVK